MTQEGWRTNRKSIRKWKKKMLEKENMTDDRQGTSHWLPRSQILVLIIGPFVLCIKY